MRDSRAIGIRGGGAISAMGRGVGALVAGVREGRSPSVSASDIGFPAEHPPSIARIDTALYPPSRASARAMLLDATDEAIQHAGLTRPELRDAALLVGSGGFLYASGIELQQRRSGLVPDDEPFRVCAPDWGARQILEHVDLGGPIRTLTTGCSSSANALLLALELLQRRESRRALVVGAECVSAVALSGFEGLLLLDPNGCRPFDRDRSGMRLGEAVTALVLEPDESPGWRLVGGANRCDVHHLTSASPGGEVMREVMAEALESCARTPADVTLVKAHGTGTIDSDAAEAAAISTLFGAVMPPVFGLKGALGHTLGACGTLEILALLACLEAKTVPPTAGFSNADPDLGLAPNRAALTITDGVVLANFFGFGGSYTTLVLEHRE